MSKANVTCPTNIPGNGAYDTGELLGVIAMTTFQTTARTEEVGPGAIKAVGLGRDEIAIANVDGDFLAFSVRCTCVAIFSGYSDEEVIDGHHHDGSRGYLPEGHLEGKTIRCPLHETVYDLRTGQPISGLGEIPLSTYEVRIEAGELKVSELSDTERHFWNDDGEKDQPELG